MRHFFCCASAVGRPFGERSGAIDNNSNNIDAIIIGARD